MQRTDYILLVTYAYTMTAIQFYFFLYICQYRQRVLHGIGRLVCICLKQPPEFHEDNGTKLICIAIIFLACWVIMRPLQAIINAMVVRFVTHSHCVRIVLLPENVAHDLYVIGY